MKRIEPIRKIIRAERMTMLKCRYLLAGSGDTFVVEPFSALRTGPARLFGMLRYRRWLRNRGSGWRLNRRYSAVRG